MTEASPIASRLAGGNEGSFFISRPAARQSSRPERPECEGKKMRAAISKRLAGSALLPAAVLLAWAYLPGQQRQNGYALAELSQQSSRSAPAEKPAQKPTHSPPATQPARKAPAAAAQPPVPKPPAGHAQPAPKASPPPGPPAAKPHPGAPPAAKPAAETPTAKPQPATAPSPPPRTPIDPNARVIQFSFANAPWEYVLEEFARISGLVLQMQVKPTGTFNYINDPRRYTLSEAMDILNTALYPKGHYLVRDGNFLKVIALQEEGIPTSLIPRIKPEDLDKHGETEFVSVVFPVKNMLAEEAAKELDNLKSKYGKVVALPSANRVMITDIVRHVRLMRNLLEDTETAAPKSQTRYFQLKYAMARNVETVVRELLGLPPRQQPQTEPRQRRPTDPRAMFFQMMMARAASRGRPGFPTGRPPFGQQQQQQQQGPQDVFTAVHERTNTLIVRAPADKLAMVEETIKLLDQPSAAGSEVQAPVPRTYRLSDGDAESLAEALRAIYRDQPGVRIAADRTNNMVIAVATPEEHRRIAQLVDEFENDERELAVIPLSVLDATTVAEILNSVYASNETDWRGRPVPRPGQPRIEADAYRNSIIVRATKKQIQDIRNYLVQMGEYQAALTSSGKMRTLYIDPKDAERVQQMIQQLWPQVRPRNNEVRIIPLRRRSQPRQERPGSQPAAPPRKPPAKSKLHEAAAKAENSAEQAAGSLAAGYEQLGYAAGQVARTVAFSDQQSGQAQPPEAGQQSQPPSRPAAKQPPAAAKPQHAEAAKPQHAQRAKPQHAQQAKPQQKRQGPPVVVSISPDGRLLIASEDPEALQAMLNLLRPFTAKSTSAANIAVFPLQAADATQVAETVRSILGLGTTFTPFGFGQRQQSAVLRIEPDVRTNSLIVYGSQSEIDRVKNLLEVLDRDDFPRSGALSSPRIIPVRYSNAADIAEVLRNVYAAQIQAAGAVGGRGPGRFPGRGPGGVGLANTLSIGVDETSNTIIVSCSESLYREISQLVEMLDEAANQADRTVQIVPTGRSLPTSVQQALYGLLGYSSQGATYGARRSGSESQRRESRGQPRPLGPGGPPGPPGPPQFFGRPSFGRPPFFFGRGGFGPPFGGGGFFRGRGR